MATARNRNPLEFYRGVAEGLTALVGGEPSYSNSPRATMHNPECAAWQTHAGDSEFTRGESYELNELGDWLKPGDNHASKISADDVRESCLLPESRNHTLLTAFAKWRGRPANWHASEAESLMEGHEHQRDDRRLRRMRDNGPAYGPRSRVDCTLKPRHDREEGRDRRASRRTGEAPAGPEPACRRWRAARNARNDGFAVAELSKAEPGMSTRDIAARFGVSQATASRDMQSIRATSGKTGDTLPSLVNDSLENEGIGGGRNHGDTNAGDTTFFGK